MKTDQQQPKIEKKSRSIKKLEIEDDVVFSRILFLEKQPGSVSHSINLILEIETLENFGALISRLKKKMKCEDLQLNLSIYADNCLDANERALIDEHLARCPLCRLKLADFQALRNDLRGLPRQTMPADLLAATRRRMTRATESKSEKSIFGFSESFSEWLQMRLMPYSVGAALSLIFGVSLLWLLLSGAYLPNGNMQLARNDSTGKSTVMLSDYQYQNLQDNAELSAASYSATRLAVAGESPSLNPQGALVALTKSIVRGKMKDDEVVVVADVFQNGIAKIAEVVEPSSDRRAVKELEKALKDDPNYAPFVPAVYDRRSDTVRVILKINTVDVKTNNKTNNKAK